MLAVLLGEDEGRQKKVVVNALQRMLGGEGFNQVRGFIHVTCQQALVIDDMPLQGRFIAQEHAGRKQACAATQDPSCSQTGQTDVMGYHDQREIPNYWSYAEQFVLQDRMFEPNASWSLPTHLFTVSGWSARCANENPASCTNNLRPLCPILS